MARILIVEDEYNVRRLMKTMLEQLSHEVYILKTTDEALKFLENTSLTRVKPSYSAPNCCAEDIPNYQGQHDVDLIISDWHVKGSTLNGVQFLEMVQVRFGGIKTVLMTASPTDDLPDIKCPVLTKPFEIDELKITIDELMAA
jgi:CheY-like chemotaxis protein